MVPSILARYKLVRKKRRLVFRTGIAVGDAGGLISSVIFPRDISIYSFAFISV